MKVTAHDRNTVVPKADLYQCDRTPPTRRGHGTSIRDRIVVPESEPTEVMTYLSSDESKRRTFTQFRHAINALLRTKLIISSSSRSKSRPRIGKMTGAVVRPANTLVEGRSSSSTDEVDL